MQLNDDSHTWGPFGAPPKTQVFRIRDVVPKSEATADIC